MPRPRSDERKGDYVHRFMASPEANKDYPDSKQRYAVAMSLWEHRNMLYNATGYDDSKAGAEMFCGHHLQLGVVRYEYITNPVTGKKGVDLLLTKEAVDSMRQSMRGIPVVNWEHKPIDPEKIADYIKDGTADGITVASEWNGNDAWEDVKFFCWTEEGKENCRNGFQLSCAYKPRDGENDIVWTPGKQAGIPYDGVIRGGKYTHLAIVPNPRYEGAVIHVVNSGGIKGMILELLGLGKEKVALDKSHPIKVDGKERTVEELVNALAKADAAAATISKEGAPGEMKAGDALVVDGKKRTYEEILNALKVADAPAPKTEPKADEKVTMTKEEMTNAIKAEASKLLDSSMESLKGHAFFNAVEKLSQMRPDQDTQPHKKRGEAARVKAGADKYGQLESAKPVDQAA